MFRKLVLKSSNFSINKFNNKLIIIIIINLLLITLAVKKNCSLVVQIVTWFAAVGTRLRQSSSGSGSRDTHHV